MDAYVFPGQGSQFPGMAKELYDKYPAAQAVIDEGESILGFNISLLMFNGTEEDLKRTDVTQPAIFLHGIALKEAAGKDRFKPYMVAGHSLGEITALAAAGALKWQDALKIVQVRAQAMQKACEATPSTMAAVLGLDDDIVDTICRELDALVVAANYNTPGQVVISGTLEGIALATEALKEAGAKRIVPLQVGGAFHSPVMEPAREQLAQIINSSSFSTPDCPIYQNVDGLAHRNPEEIKTNLIAQLTAPVRWSQSVRAMYSYGAHRFIEVGPGTILQGLIKKIEKSALVESMTPLHEPSPELS